MLRAGLLCFILCTLALAPLTAQLDSATQAKASAACGHLADDSVWVDSLWKPGPQTLVSINAYGLHVPELQGMPVPLEYPAHLREEHVQGRVVATGIIGGNGRTEPGSVHVVETPHPDFVPVVEKYLYGAHFSRPSLRGRPVRVCIALPIDFHVLRRS